MINDYLTQAVIFLINVFFELYILAILLRYLLASAGADFYNPLSQFIIKITNPPLKPLRRFIANYFGIDWPVIILLVLIQGIEITLILWVGSGHFPTLSGLSILTIAHLLKLIIYVYIFIIIIQAILSWFNPHANPIIIIIYQLSEPVLKTARKLFPPAGGLDWSPLIVIIIMNLLLILIVLPLMDMGNQLAF